MMVHGIYTCIPRAARCSIALRNSTHLCTGLHQMFGRAQALPGPTVATPLLRSVSFRRHFLVCSLAEDLTEVRSLAVVVIRVLSFWLPALFLCVRFFERLTCSLATGPAVAVYFIPSILFIRPDRIFYPVG